MKDWKTGNEQFYKKESEMAPTAEFFSHNAIFPLLFCFTRKETFVASSDIYLFLFIILCTVCYMLLG